MPSETDDAAKESRAVTYSRERDSAVVKGTTGKRGSLASGTRDQETDSKNQSLAARPVAWRNLVCISSFPIRNQSSNGPALVQAAMLVSSSWQPKRTQGFSIDQIDVAPYHWVWRIWIAVSAIKGEASPLWRWSRRLILASRAAMHSRRMIPHRRSRRGPSGAIGYTGMVETTKGTCRQG